MKKVTCLALIVLPLLFIQTPLLRAGTSYKNPSDVYKLPERPALNPNQSEPQPSFSRPSDYVRNPPLRPTILPPGEWAGLGPGENENPLTPPDDSSDLSNFGRVPIEGMLGD